MNKLLMALDRDGVLLDCKLAYGKTWGRDAGGHPIERDPDASWRTDRWDVQRFTGERLAYR